jgi:hypothetical protein
VRTSSLTRLRGRPGPPPAPFFVQCDQCGCAAEPSDIDCPKYLGDVHALPPEPFELGCRQGIQHEIVSCLHIGEAVDPVSEDGAPDGPCSIVMPVPAASPRSMKPEREFSVTPNARLTIS